MTGVPTSIPIAAGSLLHNKYEPIERIGKGGFGDVWLALDRALNHSYAIKILNPGLTVIDQLREAQIGHAFTHNNLVRVHQADVLTDGRVIIAMEYLSDGPITTLANSANFLPLPIATRAIIDVLQGLEHLHTSNLFHNDIKPENILRGPQGQARLGDYGIVGVSADGHAVPAPAWYVLHVAPETKLGQGIEVRTDVFQTGLTLYRLLSGVGTLHAKFETLGEEGYEAALASGKLLSEVDFPPFLPRSVVRIIKKSIDPEPGNRFQSALEMRRALEKLSIPGYWTTNSSGLLVGVDARHTYRFESFAASGSCASFTSFKKNKRTLRETKIAKFTRKNQTNAEVKRIKKNFLRAVVMGDV